MRFASLTSEEASAQTGMPSDSPGLLDALAAARTPTRSTSGSAGYDFVAPFRVDAKAGETVSMPLLVKVVDMPKDAVLLIFNRSGLSLKRGLRLDNAVGVIDSDYKDGIIFQATATKDISIERGDRICQGIFLNFLTVDGDDAAGERAGGLGSTGR